MAVVSNCKSRVSTIVLSANVFGPMQVSGPGPSTSLVPIPGSENAACGSRRTSCAVQQREEFPKFAIKKVCLSSITAIANNPLTDAAGVLGFLAGDVITITFSLGFGGFPQTITLAAGATNLTQVIKNIPVNICVPCGQPVIASAVFTTTEVNTPRSAHVELVFVFDCDCDGKTKKGKINSCQTDRLLAMALSGPSSCLRQCIACTSLNVLTAFVNPNTTVTLVPALGFGNQLCFNTRCRRSVNKAKLTEIIAFADDGTFDASDVLTVTVSVGQCVSQTFVLARNPIDLNQRLLVIPVNLCTFVGQVISASVRFVRTIALTTPAQVTLVAVFDCAGRGCCTLSREKACLELFTK